MQKEFENIDELFSSELNDFSVAPPAGAWKGIEEKLNSKKAKTLPYAFSRIAASLILFLASASLGVYMFTNSISDNSTNLAATVKLEKAIVTENTQSETIMAFVSAENEKPKLLKKHTAPIDKVPSIIIEEKLRLAIVVEDTIQTIENKEEEIQENIFADTEIISSTVDENEPTVEQEQKDKQEQINDYNSYNSLLAEFDEIEEYNGKSKQKNRWAIGGQAGPQYSYRQLNSDYDAQEYLDLYDESEAGIMAYAGGVNIAYSPVRRLSIQSGVYYSKIGQTASAQPVQYNKPDEVIYQTIPGVDLGSAPEKYIIPQPQLRISSSLGSTPNPQAVSTSESAEAVDPNIYNGVSRVSQYMEFLEVPLIARYAIVDRKVNFHLLGGVSTNFLIASPVYLDNGQYYNEANNLNKINYSSTVGLGLGYTFSSKLIISIEPQFKYYINKINTGSTTEVHPYSIGVFTGVSYLF